MALKVTCFVSKVIFKTSANYVAQNHWSAQDTKRSETNRPLEPHGTEPPTNRTDTNRPEVPVWLCEPTRTQTNRGIPDFTINPNVKQAMCYQTSPVEVAVGVRYDMQQKKRRFPVQWSMDAPQMGVPIMNGWLGGTPVLRNLHIEWWSSWLNMVVRNCVPCFWSYSSVETILEVTYPLSHSYLG